MTPEEARNLELGKRYEALYNTDVHAFSECYAEDCNVMGFIHGRAQLLAIEQRVCKAAPNRQLRVDHRHVFGSMLVMEAVLLDPDKGPDWKIPICIVATCRDGMIAIDRSYAEFSKWPMAPAS
jgi:hypothetical protein